MPEDIGNLILNYNVTLDITIVNKNYFSYVIKYIEFINADLNDNYLTGHFNILAVVQKDLFPEKIKKHY